MTVSRVPSGQHQAAMWPPRGPLRVLLILDHDPPLARLVERTLTQIGYAVHTTTWAEDGAAPGTQPPHLVLVDLDPVGDRLAEHTGGRGTASGRVPVIGLTRHQDLKSKLDAFAVGVDDVLTIPFAQEELKARIGAVIRRSYEDAVTFYPVIRRRGLEVDILNRTIHDGTSEIHLSSLEQSLLYLLAANAGRVVSRQEILDTLWGRDYIPESNVVDRQIRNLRKRLQDDWKQPRFIFTVLGRGYRFLPAAASA